MASKGSKMSYGLGVFAVTGFVAIAVIVLVGFMYTSSADCAKTHAGWGEEPFDLKGYDLKNHTLEIEFANSGTEQILIEQARIKREDTDISRDLESRMSVGATTTLRFEGFNRSESCNTFHLNLKYDRTSLKDLEAEGRITWNIES